MSLGAGVERVVWGGWGWGIPPKIHSWMGRNVLFTPEKWHCWCIVDPLGKPPGGRERETLLGNLLEPSSRQFLLALPEFDDHEHRKSAPNTSDARSWKSRIMMTLFSKHHDPLIFRIGKSQTGHIWTVPSKSRTRTSPIGFEGPRMVKGASPG